MNELKSFKHPMFGELPVIMLNEKEFFGAIEVAVTLGYSNPQKAVRDHCLEKGCTIRSVLTNGGNQSKKFINEGNLYRLIARSKLPSALKFETWIFDEVLPSIRKNGAYMTEQTLEKALTNPDFLIQLATQLKGEKEKLKIEKAKTAMLEQTVAEYEPKINYLDTILNSKDTVLISQIADDYGITGQKMNKLLHEHGIQYKINDQWLLYAKHKGQGYTKSKPVDIKHSDGSYSVKLNTRWTQKGRLFIYETLKSYNILPLMDIQLNKQVELAGVNE